ncbi:hypothetical protein ACHAWU_004545 [Discostella pseudostelligera]|uniref:L domain-like protein n=1 Tax=Discostella pseudostelligera TaxID=259834 RepID=A0ABD3MXR4_9STRA
MPVSNQKVNSIFAGCEDLLNDLSLPEEHKDRFVSIDLTSKTGTGNSIMSSPTSTPGAARSNNMKSKDKGSKKAWERAIDKYVASVLEDEKEAKGESSTTMKATDTLGSISSRQSRRSTRSNRPHPDNHLLAALQRDISSSRPASSCSVDIDGHIDDSSFAPINPFNADNSDDKNGDTDPNRSPRLEKVKKYLKEEWKPISLIALVILVTIIVSVSVNSQKAVSSGAGKSETPGYAMDTTLDKEINIIPTTKITESPSSDYPTYAPTVGEEEEEVEVVEVVEVEEMEDDEETRFALPTTTKSTPTLRPIPAPTSKPSVKPSASKPTEYFEMKKAAVYVTGSKEPFDNAASPQSLAFHWLYNEGKSSRNLFEFFEQYATAVLFFSLTQARTLYAVMNNATERVYDDWTEKQEVCGWEGVRCAYNYTSEMIHVTEIRLSNKNLTGTIPDEIAFLPYLNRLDLSDNAVSGTVPMGVYELKKLRYLFLNNNRLTGTISPAIDNLHLAEQIYLGQNKFNGTLPINIGDNRPNNWRFFSVYDNQLTGMLHEGMKLANAFMLDFSRNRFYGTIPNDIDSQNYTTLRLLYLDHNSLTGTIPTGLMQIKKLKGLFLNDNRLEGMIPYTIDSDEKISLLTIRAQNNQLTQPVASSICDLNVEKGYYELVELSVDCEICPDDCSLCAGRCY